MTTAAGCEMHGETSEISEQPHWSNVDKYSADLSWQDKFFSLVSSTCCIWHECLRDCVEVGGLKLCLSPIVLIYVGLLLSATSPYIPRYTRFC